MHWHHQVRCGSSASACLASHLFHWPTPRSLRLEFSPACGSPHSRGLRAITSNWFFTRTHKCVHVAHVLRARRPRAPLVGTPQAGQTGPNACRTASSSPGKRLSRSSRRSELMYCVPSGFIRMTPASRNTLKWCDAVDFATDKPKAPHGCSSRAARLLMIESRSGSLNACKTPDNAMLFLDG